MALVSDPEGYDHWHILPGQGAYYNPPMIRDGQPVKHTGYTTDLIGEFSIEWIKNRDKSKPFLLMSQHKAPHREWAPALRHLGWNGDREFPEPKDPLRRLFGTRSRRTPQDMTLAKTFTPLDAKLTAPPSLNPNNSKRGTPTTDRATPGSRKLTGEALVRWRYQRYMHDYLGTVKAVDEAVGALLDALEAEGIADETLVVLSSDQGFYLGEHGWFDKRWIYEESLTTPLLARWPGKIAPGTRGKGLVSILDLRKPSSRRRENRARGHAGPQPDALLCERRQGPRRTGARVSTTTTTNIPAPTACGSTTGSSPTATSSSTSTSRRWTTGP